MIRPGLGGDDPFDQARLTLRRLRKPLGVIAAYAAQFENGTIAGPEGTLEGAFAVISRQAREALRIVDSIQPSDAGLDLPLPSREVDLAGTVARAVDRISVAAAKSGASVETDVPACRLPVRTQEEDLSRILDNLLDNAIRHCPGRARVRVDVRPGDVIVVAVCDRGPGIPNEIRSLIFQPPAFRPRSQQGRVGVGLVRSRQLAERNGAELQLASTGGGQGTTFLLRWPRLIT